MRTNTGIHNSGLIENNNQKTKKYNISTAIKNLPSRKKKITSPRANEKF
jgi:hypothetical protein